MYKYYMLNKINKKINKLVISYSTAETTSPFNLHHQSHLILVRAKINLDSKCKKKFKLFDYAQYNDNVIFMFFFFSVCSGNCCLCFNQIHIPMKEKIF